jgi:trehalose 6-phosphate synthase/phosphatase
MSTTDELNTIVDAVRTCPTLLVLLDYDGTLVPFAPVPDLAIPDGALLALLRDLSARANTTVHLVSGRTRVTLDRWFGSLPIWLHAEHGVWSRPPAGTWQAVDLPPPSWIPRVLPILEDFQARTPGSLIEHKTAALAWHYRMADPEFGAHQANELRLHLTELVSNEPVEILPGDKVIEIRPHGVHKGRVVELALRDMPADAGALAMGDDHTDEDMFAALPPAAVAIHVGPAPSRAPLRLRDHQAARHLLARLLSSDDSKCTT